MYPTSSLARPNIFLVEVRFFASAFANGKIRDALRAFGTSAVYRIPIVSADGVR